VLGVPQRHLEGDQAEVLAEGAGLERQRLVRGAVRHPVNGVGQEVRLAAGESLAEVLNVAVRVDVDAENRASRKRRPDRNRCHHQ